MHNLFHKGLKKKLGMNFSLPLGQTALKFCLPWLSLVQCNVILKLKLKLLKVLVCSFNDLVDRHLA